MVKCPVRVTYNQVVVFFAQERKTAFKLAYRVTFAIAKSLVCFKFHISLKNIHFQSGGNMYNHRYMSPGGLIGPQNYLVQPRFFEAKKP